jgi:hypothetical protein
MIWVITCRMSSYENQIETRRNTCRCACMDFIPVSDYVSSFVEQARRISMVRQHRRLLFDLVVEYRARHWAKYCPCL